MSKKWKFYFLFTKKSDKIKKIDKNGDYSGMVNAQNPWSVRSGNHNNNANAGVFYFNTTNGNTNTNGSFRQYKTTKEKIFL